MRKLGSIGVSSFCDGMAVMYASGIQMDEAVATLADGSANPTVRKCCQAMYPIVSGGGSLSRAMTESGAFPGYAVTMVEAGEKSGHLEEVLRNLASYYADEARIFAKVKSAIVYPALLLCVMSVILLFTVVVVIPEFVGVYNSYSGSMASSSFSFVLVAMTIGWVALGATALFTAIALVSLLMARSAGGQRRLIGALEVLPFTRTPLRELSLARFTSALATCVSAGMQPEDSIHQADEMVDNKKLRRRIERVTREVSGTAAGKPLVQAIADSGLYSTVHSHMLMVGSKAGSTVKVLESLSKTFFDDSMAALNMVIDSVEPALAALLTLGVGCTLISAMLPLIGIMGGIG